MMVDFNATGKRGSVVDILSEKDEEGRYISGGWKSQGGRLSCGYSSFRGKRATMEDLFDIKTSKIDGQTVSLFGIFDGESYQQTDAAFLDSERDTYRDDGNHLYVANVGDSCTTISKVGQRYSVLTC